MAGFWRYDVPIAYRGYLVSGSGPLDLAYTLSYQPLVSGDDEFIIQADQFIDLGPECSFSMTASLLVPTNNTLAVRLYDLTNSRTLCSVALVGPTFIETTTLTAVNYYATLSGDIMARFEYLSTVPAANGIAGIQYAYVKLRKR